MNLKQIREECWDVAREVTDIDQDRLWSKREMDRYINRIYRWIARETKCIRDAITPEICNITCTPVLDPVYGSNPSSWLYGIPVIPQNYALDSRIIDIDEVKWTNLQWRLTKVSVRKWQPNPWWEQVVGMSTEYCTDYSNNLLTLNFRMEIADTLRLIVKRLPLTSLVLDTDTPEFRESYHDYFINGILWQMYSKQDADTIDLKKAADYQAMFLRDVDEIKQQELILDQRLKANNSLEAFR